MFQGEGGRSSMKDLKSVPLTDTVLAENLQRVTLDPPKKPAFKIEAPPILSTYFKKATPFLQKVVEAPYLRRSSQSQPGSASLTNSRSKTNFHSHHSPRKSDGVESTPLSPKGLQSKRKGEIREFNNEDIAMTL